MLGTRVSPHLSISPPTSNSDNYTLMMGCQWICQLTSIVFVLRDYVTPLNRIIYVHRRLSNR